MKNRIGYLRASSVIALLSFLLAACGGQPALQPTQVSVVQATTPSRPAATTTLVLPPVTTGPQAGSATVQTTMENSGLGTEAPVGGTAEAVPPGWGRLVVMTHDSFSASEGVIQAFEQANQVKVEFLKAGDAGAALNQAILTKNSPLADVLYGVDNTFLGRALDADIFDPYQPHGIEAISTTLRLDPQNRVTPVDYGDVCLNYDKAYFQQKGLQPPATLEDLARPEMKGLTVVENPATSSPGLAFLLATVDHFGPTGWQDYWQKLRANDVAVTDGWEQAYFEKFSAGGGSGDRPIVVSYATSPVYGALNAPGGPAEPTTGNVLGKQACFRQVEFVGILKGTKNRELAEQWIDFMISPAFQEDMPLQMYVFPVSTQAKLPTDFARFAQIPAQPSLLAPDLIAKNRDAWISQWTDIDLR